MVEDRVYLHEVLLPGREDGAFENQQVLHNVRVGEDDESLVSNEERVHWAILLRPAV